MKDKLTRLRNTLSLIETRGESTMIMAECLQFIGQCINECEEKDTKLESGGKA